MNDAVEMKDELVRFNITVPTSWIVTSKEELISGGSDPRTLFKFKLPSHQTIMVMYDGKCLPNQFDDAYNSNVANMRQAGDIHNEQTIVSASEQIVKRLFIDMKAQDGSLFRMCHNFTLINDYIVNFSGGPVDSTISSQDLSGLMNDPVSIALYNLTASIKTV